MTPRDQFRAAAAAFEARVLAYWGWERPPNDASVGRVLVPMLDRDGEWEGRRLGEINGDEISTALDCSLELHERFVSQMEVGEDLMDWRDGLKMLEIATACLLVLIADQMPDDFDGKNFD